MRLLDNHEAYVLANQRAGRRQGEVSDGQKAVVARLLPSLKLTKPGDGRVNGILTANTKQPAVLVGGCCVLSHRS